jgi:hypothetical protein
MKHETIRPVDILVGDLLRSQRTRTLHDEERPSPRAEHLSDDHPLKRQAILVFDALESVTNGMDNPDVFSELEKIPRDSLFISWISLVYAIRAFYENDIPRVVQELSAIPVESAPHVLVPLLLALSGKGAKKNLRGNVAKRIFEEIENPDGLLLESINGACEALAEGREEIFSDTIAFLAKELYGTSVDLSKKTSLWALGVLKAKNWEGTLLEDNLRLIYGDMETLRLKALALMEGHPREAFSSWVYFTLLFIENPRRTEGEIESVFLIGSILLEKALPFDEIYGYAWEGLTADFSFLLKENYPSIAQRTADCEDVAEIFRRFSPIDPKGPSVKPFRPRKKPAVQMEFEF